MSLRASQFVAHQANNIGFPTTGGKTKKSGPKKTGTKRVSAEEKAEQARLDDPYGGGQTRKGEGRTRVVRRRVRRRRVSNGQAKPNYGTSKTQQAKTVKQAKSQQLAQQQGPDSQKHMMRMNSQSSLNRMTAGFRSQQAGRPQGPQTPVGKKMAMLGNLKNYMSNDYAAMKANDGDKAFTYRTSEARQLVATLGTMVASSTKQGKSDTNDSTEKKPLSPKQFAAQKGLLKRLKMMSDPSGQMPEGLPPEYRPFESVA
jgi:hypothetical protein